MFVFLTGNYTVFILHSESLVKLCQAIYNSHKADDIDSKYPIGLYKLLIYYEEIAVFESLYLEEKEETANASSIIAELFSYSLMIDNPLLAIFLRNCYAEEIFDNSKAVIDSIFSNLSRIIETFNHQD